MQDLSKENFELLVAKLLKEGYTKSHSVLAGADGGVYFTKNADSPEWGRGMGEVIGRAKISMGEISYH